MATEASSKGKSILHFCARETLRPIRDQVLRLSGFQVNSTQVAAELIQMLRAKPYDLVLIDVEGQESVEMADRLCSEVKTNRHGQIVVFACNYRVAMNTECPDEVVRSEFDPGAFVSGVRNALEAHG